MNWNDILKLFKSFFLTLFYVVAAIGIIVGFIFLTKAVGLWIIPIIIALGFFVRFWVEVHETM